MKNKFILFFRSRRSRDMKTSVIPTPPKDVERALPEPTPQTFPQISIGYSQSVGLHREHNEDAMFTLITTLCSNQGNIPIGLFIVADGMGGHKHGELASNLAVRTVGSQIIRKILVSLLSPNGSGPDESIQEILQNSFQDAHQEIVKNIPESGTTLTALLILDQQMTIAHVGDSRIYLISPEGKAQAMTRDHSLVMRMLELGHLTPEEAVSHPQRNVLYRALGLGEPIIPDVNTYPLPSSGHILLCSDGLWGMIPEDEIAQLVNQAPNPQSACQSLVDAANRAGGTDNITAILVGLLGR